MSLIDEKIVKEFIKNETELCIYNKHGREIHCGKIVNYNKEERLFVHSIYMLTRKGEEFLYLPVNNNPTYGYEIKKESKKRCG